MTKCPVCGTDARVKREDYKFTELGLKNVVLKGIEVISCPECGLSPRIPRMNDLMRTIAIAVILRPGRLAGEEVRFLRKHLGLTAERFSEVLGVDKTTISKWENDEDPVGTQSDRLIRLTALALGDGLQEKARELLEIFTSVRDQKKKPKIEVDPKTMEYSYAA